MTASRRSSTSPRPLALDGRGRTALADDEHLPARPDRARAVHPARGAGASGRTSAAACRRAGVRPGRRRARAGHAGAGARRAAALPRRPARVDEVTVVGAGRHAGGHGLLHPAAGPGRVSRQRVVQVSSGVRAVRPSAAVPVTAPAPALPLRSTVRRGGRWSRAAPTWRASTSSRWRRASPRHRTLLVHLLNGAVDRRVARRPGAGARRACGRTRGQPGPGRVGIPGAGDRWTAREPGATRCRPGFAAADAAIVRRRPPARRRCARAALVVRTTSSGDWSVYVLALLAPDGRSVPDGFDDPLSTGAVQRSPSTARSDLDCRPLDAR